MGFPNRAGSPFAVPGDGPYYCLPMGNAIADSQKKQHGGAKETVESIIIALILAFVFRAFVVEAFVIPTGSMAPTLMGAHSRYVCENCGYHFDVNAGGRSIDGDLSIPRRVGGEVRVNCPNCGYLTLDEQSANPKVYYGDRILVLKYLYLLNQPQRWDVVVFKSPVEPEKYDYSQNYIKRLVGRPGERIMLLDGDVYVATKPHPTDADWQIQTKPDVVQDALWRVVSDMDHYPLGLRRNGELSTDPAAALDYVPWKGSSERVVLGRDSTGARTFTLDASQSRERLRFDPSVALAKHSLTDWLAYDQSPRPQGKSFTVGDLKLSMFYQRQGGDGELRLNLSKRDDLFTAAITRGRVTLLRQTGTDASPVELASRSISLPDRPVHLEFVNLDYRVSLRVDGREVLSTTPQQYHPDVTALKADPNVGSSFPAVFVTADNQKAALTHLSLWRDIYYTSKTYSGENVVRGGPDNPVLLGDNEYFCLGDNSPMSLDGRYWPTPVKLPYEGVETGAGIVPGRFLLGKALFVYWPAGFRVFNDEYWDVVPNFGEMRFIH